MVQMVDENAEGVLQFRQVKQNYPHLSQLLQKHFQLKNTQKLQLKDLNSMFPTVQDIQGLITEMNHPTSILCLSIKTKKNTKASLHALCSVCWKISGRQKIKNNCFI